MSAPDLYDIGTRCQGELPPGNGAPSSQGGAATPPLRLSSVSQKFSPAGPAVAAAAAAGPAAGRAEGPAEPEDISIRGDKESGKPEGQETRMLVDSLTRV